MKCAIEGCTNEARYIASRDGTPVMTCAICPLKLGLDSIAIRFVPALLAFARAYGEGSGQVALFEHVREGIGYRR